MGTRVYEIQFENVAIAAIQDLFSLKAGAANGVRLRYMCLGALGQSSAAEFRVSLKRFPATVTQGTGGSVPTVNFTNDGDTKAAAATGHANDVTTQMSTSGTAQTLESYTWNVLLPFEYIPSDVDERAACQAAEGLSFTLNAAPGASTNCSGTLRWEENP